jgi:hypothetical protein
MTREKGYRDSFPIVKLIMTLSHEHYWYDESLFN